MPLATPVVSTFANGLRLLVTPMPYARSASASSYVAAGSTAPAIETTVAFGTYWRR